MVGGTDLLLPFLGEVEEGSRCELGVRCPGRKGLHFGKRAFPFFFNATFSEGSIDLVRCFVATIKP